MRQMRRMTGAAGLAYVAGISIENMEALAAPRLGSPADQIRAAFEVHALGVVTSTAGALSIVFYWALAIGLYRMLRAAAPAERVWPVVALVGGVGAPLLAMVGVVAQGSLFVTGGAVLSDEAVREIF